jgi:Tol biopolymer transport system component
MVRSRILLLVMACLAGDVSSTEAQYFGRNKVQYDTFEFKTLKTEHFDIYYYEEERVLANHVARMAERWYARLTRALDHHLSSRQPLVLYASHPDFEQTNVVSGLMGESTGGVTESLRRRIVLPAGASLAETDHVVGHELVHAFQYDIGTGNMQRMALLPLWFVEGMAEYLSIGPNDPHTAMWMRDAVLSERLPTIKQLQDSKYFPYRYGQALWAYLGSRFGDDVVGNAMYSGMTGDAVGAIETVTGVDEKTLSKDWHDALRKLYATAARGAQSPDAIGVPLITKEVDGGELNIAPAISPDGSQIVFLSEKNLVSIDMFLADAATGEVTRKLIETSADPHFDSLQFINSAGSWDARGTRFVVGAIRRGRPYLAILDIARGGRIEREIPFDQLGEIYHPTWSPDGRRIAFSAIAGGVSDLYIYDLGDRSGEDRSGDDRKNEDRKNSDPSSTSSMPGLQKLTSDAYADLQPAWSPDGKTIAFVTDRYTTNLERLEYKAYRLATIDVATREMRELPAVPPIGRLAAKHIVPQWSGDGASLFFLSDASGITNIYRLTLASGEIAQLTDIATGVTGLTHLSPSLSVAAATGRIAFSAFRAGRYGVYTIDSGLKMTAVTPRVPAPGVSASAASTVGSGVSDRSAALGLPETPTAAQSTPLVPSMLAPPRPGGEVVRLLENSTLGLPPPSEFPAEEYDSKLKLDYVGQPYVNAGVNRFGSFVGGGVSFVMSDMLGDRTLGAVVQIQGEFDTFGGQLSYINRRSRFNWGLVAEQIPYITGRFRQSLDTIGDEPVVRESIERFNQIHRQAAGVVAYPLSRSQRLEFTGGLHQISFNRRIDEQVYSLATGRILSEERRDLPAPGSITLAETNAALVFDTSIYGATSPILGRRYRLEVSPTFGDLPYTSLLVDFRQYVMPFKPVTVAARFLHYGRYGSAAEDVRLTPLYLGYPHLIRGYDFGSFHASECVANGQSSCPAFDRLIGSRLLIANAEVRFPLLGLFKREFVYGPVPLEGVIFGDAGVAWTRDDNPTFADGTRDVVRSVGAGVRVNAFGFAVVEFDAVRPLDRPGRGWMFAFSFSPGF